MSEISNTNVQAETILTAIIDALEISQGYDSEDEAYYIDYSATYITKLISDMLYSRDSAMLEKYKEAVARTLKDHCMYPGKIDVIISSLDSAFAEIEGGK